MDNSEKAGVEGIDVRYVAHLARMHLSDKEAATFQGQLDQVVGMIDKLGQLDLEGIEPTSHAHPVNNVFRPDEVRPGLDHDCVMNNAPAVVHGQFQVPKIVE